MTLVTLLAASCTAPEDEVDHTTGELKEGPIGGPIDPTPPTVPPTVPGPLEGTMNGTMNASLNATMNSALNATMNGALNGTMNSTANAALNAALLGSLNGDIDDPLEPLEPQPEGPLEGTMNATLDASLAATLSARLEEASFEGTLGDLGPDLSAFTIAEVEHRCAPTVLTATQGGRSYRVQVPRLSILLGDLVDTGATVTSDRVTYRALTTYAIACEDRAVRVILLSPTPADTTVRTYEDDVTHMCARFRDADAPPGGRKVWFCGTGTLGAGTPVYAQPALAPTWGPQRVAFPASIEFGANRFAGHFAWSATLGPISRRIEGHEQDGYTSAAAWGLNPNDTWPDGRSKARDYVAAVALKATTGRTGVKINPYVYNSDPGHDPAQLNDCEVAGDDRYLTSPDLTSSGQLDGIFVDLRVSAAFADRCAGWLRRFGLAQAEVRARDVQGRQCHSFKVGRTGATDAPRVGLNVVDSDPNRTWCPAGLASFGASGSGEPSRSVPVPSAGEGTKTLAVIEGGVDGPQLVALGGTKVCVVNGNCSVELGQLVSLVAYGDRIAVTGTVSVGFTKQARVWILRLDRTSGVTPQVVTSFALPVTSAPMSSLPMVTDIAAGNLDVAGDDDLELVITATATNAVLVADPQADGTFRVTSQSFGQGPRAVHVANLDGGRGDEMIVATTQGAAVIARQGIMPALRVVRSLATSFPVTAVATGRIDGDERADIVVATTQQVHVFVARAGFRYDLGRDVSRRGATGLVVTDLNRDGHTDVVANHGWPIVHFQRGANRTIDVFFGWGDGYFQESFLEPPYGISYGGVVAYDSADGGLVDLAALRRPGNGSPSAATVADLYFNTSQ